jgi:deazaflavin-dependent oxidoreductase (nitroreductase family)
MIFIIDAGMRCATDRSDHGQSTARKEIPMSDSQRSQSDASPDTSLGPRKTFSMDWKHRLGNPFPAGLAWLGIGPFQLLYTRGRKTGKTRKTPVTLVDHDGIRWLVAPYGEVAWVHNARAAGLVTIRDGRSKKTYAIREVTPQEAGPVLRKYVSIAGATRPYFWASLDAPVEEFVREAHLHPVFALEA